MDGDTNIGTNDEESIDSGTGAGKIFDISDDNISPVDTAAEEAARNPIATPDEQKAALEAIEKQESLQKKVEISLDDELAGIPSANIKVTASAPVPIPAPSPRSVSTIPPVVPVQQAPELQAMPRSTVVPVFPNPVRNSPSSPPTKTIYSNNFNHAPEPTPLPTSNLQNAMDAILPTKVSENNAPIPARQFGGTPTNPPIPVVSPINPPRIPVPSNIDPSIKRLRTYESDVADLLSHTQSPHAQMPRMETSASVSDTARVPAPEIAPNLPSMASIAIAEQRKLTGVDSLGSASEPSEPSHAGRKIFAFLVSLIFIGGGIIGAYYLYTQSPLAPSHSGAAIQTPAIASIIPADSQTVINIDNLNTTQILAKINTEVSKPGQPNSIKEIVLAQNVAGSFVQISAMDIIHLFNIPAPDMLVRSLLSQWMLGEYTDASGATSVFVSFKNNFFQNAFAGMLEWEKVMPDDLRLFLSSSSVHGIANVTPTTPTNTINVLPPTTTSSSTASSTVASSTSKIATSTHATSTPPTVVTKPNQSYLTVQGHFIDGIIHNKDVRIFKTNDGQTLFLYSFIDNSTLVFAPNEATLSEIISRLEKQELLR